MLPSDNLLVQFFTHPVCTRIVTFIIQLEKPRVPGGPNVQLRVISLRQINKPPVVAEVRVHQFRAFIQTQAFANQPVKMSHEKIGQIKRARLSIR